MIGDSPHPFLFIHIPKTAGTSMEHALIPLACCGKSLRALSEEELTLHALPGGKRMPTAGTYRVRGGVVQHECVEYFQDRGELEGREIFTVVRNPYDRALSEIFYLMRLFPAAESIFRGPTWAADLKAYAAYEGYLAHDLKACQVDWLMDRNGAMRCDRILRFESLAMDWHKLCGDWGIGDVSLPHSNAAGRNIPWWEYYDEEAAHAIARKYARDFELLGYDTALPVTDDATKRQRTLWLGEGNAPDSAMFLTRQQLRHGRLEIPHRCMGAVHVHGNLERLTYEDTKHILGRYRDLLVEGGEMILHTLDLEFFASLVTNGYEEGSVQDQFVRSYVDEFMPVGSYYSPAAVLSHLLLHKGFVTLYDKKILENLLASIALTSTEANRDQPGVLEIHARTAAS